MGESEHRSTKQHYGDQVTAISDGLVALLKDYYGQAPSEVKSYYHDDVVVCVLRGGFSRAERTLLDGGRGSLVLEHRAAFQAVMRDRFAAVVEAAVDRAVVAFMSGHQQDPDMMCQVFVLAPAAQRAGRSPELSSS